MIDIVDPIIENVNLMSNVVVVVFVSTQVTIHNVTDAKFSRSPVLNMRDGVEITPINGPSSYTINSNLAVGSQRPTSTPAATTNIGAGGISEFGGLI